MDGQNPWAAQFSMGPKQQSKMPAPNMQQAAGAPTASPSPFPSSGFAKQGMTQQKSAIPAPQMPGGE